MGSSAHQYYHHRHNVTRAMLFACIVEVIDSSVHSIIYVEVNLA